MKKIATRIILLAFMLTLAIFSTVHAMPNGYARIGITNAQSPINIRLGPSTDTSIVGSLSPDDVVEVIEIDDNGWYKIIFKGAERYVYSKYLDTETISVYECIGKYKTFFNFSNTNRNHNIRLASQRISVKILPGQKFKWSEVIGPASKEQGYLLGNVIIDNQMSQGYGGGVCQVSSTLYNAALSANMEIIERHTHGLPVSYVPEGRDATVAYGHLDFIFKNNKPYPIQIIGFTGNGFVEVGIYKDVKKPHIPKATKDKKIEHNPIIIVR